MVGVGDGKLLEDGKRAPIDVKTGDRIVAHRTLYGCTYSLLTRWLSRLQIPTTFCDFTDLDSVRAAIRPETRAVFVETLTNPLLKFADLPALSAICKDRGLLLIADLSQPLRFVNVLNPMYLHFTSPLAWGAPVSRNHR